MKILIIDDDKLVVAAILNKLKSKGYQDILTASDGIRALNIIEAEKIDLIISDIMMPGLTGLDLLSILKEFCFHKIPVILISSLNQLTLISTAIGMGAFDFIVKPLDFNQLLVRIEEIQIAKE